MNEICLSLGPLHHMMKLNSYASIHKKNKHLANVLEDSTLIRPIDFGFVGYEMIVQSLNSGSRYSLTSTNQLNRQNLARNNGTKGTGSFALLINICRAYSLIVFITGSG